MRVYLRDESAQTIFTCCHTEMEAADQTFHLTQSQYTATGPTSPSADPITPGAWQGSHWSANFLSHWYDSTPKKSRPQRDSNPGPSALEADALTTRPTRRSPLAKEGSLRVALVWGQSWYWSVQRCGCMWSVGWLLADWFLTFKLDANWETARRRSNCK